MDKHFLAIIFAIVLLVLFLKSEFSSSSRKASGTLRASPAEAAASAEHFANVSPVSRQECKRGLLPAHVAKEAGDKQPADYVLSTAYGYSPYQMRAFFKTFRRHNQAARILVLVSPEQATRNPLCAYGSHYNVEFLMLQPSQYYPLVLLRFLAYQELLESLPRTRVRNVLLADLRDTLFQGDPFNPAVLPASQMRKSSLSGALPYVLFSEEGDLTTRITIRSLPANLEWVETCFNKSVLTAIADSTVVCAGATLGGRNAILAYLQLMLDVAHFVAKEQCMSDGIDQGIHNFIVHYLKPQRPDLLKFEALQVSNDDSPVYTVGLIEPPRIDVSDDRFAVFNSRGVQPPIVHQVDRRDKLQNYMDIIAADGI